MIRTFIGRPVTNFSIDEAVASLDEQINRVASEDNLEIDGVYDDQIVFCPEEDRMPGTDNVLFVTRVVDFVAK